MRNRERISCQNGWHNRGSSTQGTKGGGGGNQWLPQTLKGHYKRGRQPTLKGDSVIENHNKIIEKTLSKTQRK